MSIQNDSRPAQAGQKRNVELKARLADLDQARGIAQRVATQSLGVERQVDTYYVCSLGRLKLRVINGESGQLIWYQRPSQRSSKLSHYTLVKIDDPAAAAKALAAALGVRLVVDKTREVYLAGNVRIHLDQVVRLGTFLEFEAVLNAEDDEQTGQQQIRCLCTEFGIEPDDCLPDSYSDMLCE